MRVSPLQGRQPSLYRYRLRQDEEVFSNIYLLYKYVFGKSMAKGVWTPLAFEAVEENVCCCGSFNGITCVASPQRKIAAVTIPPLNRNKHTDVLAEFVNS